MGGSWGRQGISCLWVSPGIQRSDGNKIVRTGPRNHRSQRTIEVDSPEPGSRKGLIIKWSGWGESTLVAANDHLVLGRQNDSVGGAAGTLNPPERSQGRPRNTPDRSVAV